MLLVPMLELTLHIEHWYHVLADRRAQGAWLWLKLDLIYLVIAASRAACVSGGNNQLICTVPRRLAAVFDAKERRALVPPGEMHG